jgi:cysteine synthase A
VVVAEPDNSQLLASGIAQGRNPDGSASASHPNFRPHLMQGWSPDFIPKLTADVVERGFIDMLQPVAGNDALRCARDLAAKEGIFCGTTGGATFAAALKVAENAPDGSRILVMIPDTGERYLSTPLFADIEETMTLEETDIAATTPGYRFDIKGPPVAAAAAPVEAKKEALDYVDRVIGDRDQPVVMFALEWCEFCWSVRKMFDTAGIEYRSVDLDSVPFQKDNLGTDIRAALLQKTGQPTIPQIFVGGRHIGGATETFDAFNDGSLKAQLAAVQVPFNAAMRQDAYSFLPKWLHPR